MKIRIFLLSLVLMLLSGWCFADQFMLTHRRKAMRAASACAYVHCNGFETQADDDDWTDIGIAPNYDYDFGGFAFEGSECMRMTAGAGASIVVTERAETWITVMFRTNDNNEGTENLIQLYNDSTLLGTLYYDVDTNMKILPSGGSSSSGETVHIDDGVEYIKLRFKQGTGANAELEFWASSNGTNWSQNQEETDGDTTLQLNKVVFSNSHDTELVMIDNFMENSVDITDAR